MTNAYRRVEEAYLSVESALPFRPVLGIVLGSGVGSQAEILESPVSVDYSSIVGFPRSTVEGHRGRFLFGYAYGLPTVIMQGRVHYYEGYSMEEVVLPIRLMARMGVVTLILTNAAGGIREDLLPGTLMLLSDHIASFVPSPLRGENLHEFGVRFPDMSEVYSPILRKCAHNAAQSLGLSLAEGVYLQLSGPQYETPAEIRMLRTLGADAVGMSTAVEAIAARHAGLAVLGISLITNQAAGLSKSKLSHEEVTAAADAASDKLRALIERIIAALPSDKIKARDK